MKSIEIEALRQQLEAARQGDSDKQKEFLASIISPHDEAAFIIEMDNKDLAWITPLALELFTPAVEVLNFGMSMEMGFWKDMIHDNETGEDIPDLQFETNENETVFSRDEDLINQIAQKAMASLSTLSTEDLKRLQFCWLSEELNNAINEELYSRDDPDAICERGNQYYYGDEENGIFIDFEKAKAYYDRAPEVAYEPLAFVLRRRYDSEQAKHPIFATYHISGSEVPAMRALLQELFNKFGNHTEPSKYLPLQVVMKALVGSDAYMGYIQSIDDKTPVNIEVEFYRAHTDSLKYALLQVFPDLKIEITKHD